MLCHSEADILYDRVGDYYLYFGDHYLNFASLLIVFAVWVEYIGLYIIIWPLKKIFCRSQDLEDGKKEKFIN